MAANQEGEMRTIVAAFLLLFLDRVDFLIKFTGDWPDSLAKVMAWLIIFGLVACVFQDIREMFRGEK